MGVILCICVQKENFFKGIESQNWGAIGLKSFHSNRLGNVVLVKGTVLNGYSNRATSLTFYLNIAS